MANVTIGLASYVETDVASAATCDIGAISTLRARITGTTTITSFGTNVNRIRYLRFAAALTLTHNATTLILPGGANILTAAGDTCTAMSDVSGNWRVTSYQRAATVPTGIVWANRPAAVSGGQIFVTDVGVGGSFWLSDGTDWIPSHPVVLGRSGAAITIPNNTLTTEQNYVSVTVPAGAMGRNAGLYTRTHWTMTASTNAKTMRGRFSGASGSSVFSNSVTGASFVTALMEGRIRNRNATGSQSYTPAATIGDESSGTASAMATASIDTTLTTTFYISGQTALAGEVLTLESYEVTLWP